MAGARPCKTQVPGSGGGPRSGGWNLGLITLLTGLERMAVCVYVFPCVYVCTCVCVYAHMHTCMCVHVCMCVGMGVVHMCVHV